MRRRLALLAFFSVAAPAIAVAVLAACSSSPTEVGRLPVSPDKDASKSKVDSSDPNPTQDAEPLPDGASGAGRVYAHTMDTLYLYEPISNDLKMIGAFNCLTAGDPVIDLAVDRTGTMYATTFKHFLSVDPITAKCSVLATAMGADNYPNALSFVPAGTLDPTKEALVGYAALGVNPDATDYVRIDVDGAKGMMTKVGNINGSDAGTQYKSSGDIIALIQDGNRAYVTVRVKGAAGSDSLAEIDPKTGSIKRIIGDTKESNLFGFGYWAGKGYGFSDTGRIVEINMTTGAAVVVKTLMGVGDAGPIPWYGAGVTTQAPTH